MTKSNTDQTTYNSKHLNIPIPKGKTPEELEQIVMPRKLKLQIERRVEVAEMILCGCSYSEITAKMKCSTAFISGIAKRLRVGGLLR